MIPVGPSSYHAEILEFPGCFAQGDTPADAYANLEKAAESWVDTCLSQGQEIPEPSSNVTYSGHIALRLPRSIHRQAATLADRDDTSLNTFLVSAVSAKVGAEDFYKKMAERMEQRLMQATYFACAYASFIVVARTEAKSKETIRSLSFTDTGTTTAAPKALTLTTGR
jgi:predicted RNase H-like HicB family nuclease